MLFFDVSHSWVKPARKYLAVHVRTRDRRHSTPIGTAHPGGPHALSIGPIVGFAIQVTCSYMSHTWFENHFPHLSSSRLARESDLHMRALQERKTEPPGWLSLLQVSTVVLANNPWLQSAQLVIDYHMPVHGSSESP